MTQPTPKTTEPLATNERAAFPTLALAAHAKKVGLFLLAWTWLNVMLNVRYPADENRLWYLVPSLDTTALLTAYALLGLRGVRIPKWVHGAFGVLFVLVRLSRIADGVTQRFLNRTFNPFLDLHLVAEAARLLHSTVSRPQFVLGVVCILGALPLLGVASYYASRTAARFLIPVHHVAGYAVVAAALGLLSFLHPWSGDAHPYYTGAFAKSVVPRLAADLKSFSNLHTQKRATLQRIEAAAEKLEATPHDLAKLAHANIYLFFVESYGQTVLERDAYVPRVARVYDTYDVELGKAGFAIASSVLDSPTYGGYSWLAHATLATGVLTRNELEYETLYELHPKSLVYFLKRAGYHASLLQPATMRKPLRKNLYGFDREYFSWHFGYQGPSYAWAPMPDQYVLDFVRRNVIEAQAGPQFVECVLISSHAPWSVQPPFVPDWSTLGDGSIYSSTRPVIYDVAWSDLAVPAVTRAYLRSILYDLNVLKEFIERFVQDGSLVIILGDHQPAKEVTGGSAAHGVPIHVISRNPELVEAFVQQGYQRGMRPKLVQHPRGLETFVFDFLRQFSNPR